MPLTLVPLKCIALQNFGFLFVETDQEMTERKVADPKQISALDSKYSVQALTLLAEVSVF